MRITRGKWEVIIGLVVLILFLAVMMVVVDERSSRARDEGEEGLGSAAQQTGGTTATYEVTR